MQSTVNDRALKLISIAEHMFGQITSDWHYCGVEFKDMQPHLAYYPENESVKISLSLKALDDELQLDFQLAHEVCHLLYPSVDMKNPRNPQTNVMNEGISTYFSIFIVSELYGEEMADMALKNLATDAPKYFAAFEQMTDLIKKDPNAIKKIRKIQPKINDVNSFDLQATGLQLTEDQINLLISIF